MSAEEQDLKHKEIVFSEIAPAFDKLVLSQLNQEDIPADEYAVLRERIIRKLLELESVSVESLNFTDTGVVINDKDFSGKWVDLDWDINPFDNTLIVKFRVRDKFDSDKPTDIKRVYKVQIRPEVFAEHVKYEQERRARLDAQYAEEEKRLKAALAEFSKFAVDKLDKTLTFAEWKSKEDMMREIVTIKPDQTWTIEDLGDAWKIVVFNPDRRVFDIREYKKPND